MKHVKKYELFENEMQLSGEQKEFLDFYAKNRWSVNPSTGLVEIAGDFDCSRGYVDDYIEDFLGIRFGVVKGNFDCSYNNLLSLEGAPQKVEGDFNCSLNPIFTLKGSPQEIGGDFNCSDTKLFSLKGAPQKVEGDFNCSDNNLTSLEGAPQEIGGGFYCSGNKLNSLEGAPQKVNVDFDCSDNSLSSLEGAPQEVEGDFNCRSNKLTSLEGAPQEVGATFICDVFRLGTGRWNPGGWLEITEYGSPEAQKLILTLPYLSPDYIQKEIDKNPGKMAIALKNAWKKEYFKWIKDQLVIPKGFEDDFGTQSDLSDLGF